MTLNQLLTAIAKQGFSVTIEFDDDALLNHGYPFYVNINDHNLIDIMFEYQEEIEQSLLGKAEGSGGSFKYEYDKDLNYSVIEGVYNWADKGNYESNSLEIIHNPSTAERFQLKPTKCKFPYEAFPLSFILNKEEDNITLIEIDGDYDEKVIPFLIKKFKKELKGIGCFRASFFAEGSKDDDGDYEIYYGEEETEHAYNIEKGNGIDFFETIELEEFTEKEIEGLSKTLKMTTEEFNKFLTTIEIEDE